MDIVYGVVLGLSCHSNRYHCPKTMMDKVFDVVLGA